MVRHRSQRPKNTKDPSSVLWLPVDSRLLPRLFSFGSVKGIARVFLEIEIILSILVVLGTIIIVALTIFN